MESVQKPSLGVRSAVSAVKDKNRPTPTTLERCPTQGQSAILEKARTLESFIEDATLGTPRSGLVELSESATRRVIGMFDAIAQMTKSINAPEAPSASRDQSLGEDLAHVAMMGVSGAQEGREFYFTSLYQRTHLEPESTTPTVVLPEWFSRLHHYFAVDASDTKFPDVDKYLERSRQVSGEYQSILAAIETINKDLVERRTMKARADAKGMDNNYGVGIGKLEREIAEQREKFPGLLERVGDVLPERVPELNQAVTIKATVRAEIVEYLIKSVNGFDELLTRVLVPKECEPITLPLLHFMDDGGVVVEQLDFNPGEIAAIGADNSRKQQLLMLVIAGRKMLRGILPALEEFQSSRSVVDSGVTAFRPPLSGDPSLYGEALKALCAQKDPNVIGEAIALFSLPVTFSHRDALYKIFESFGRTEPIHFLVSQGILHPDNTIGRAAIATLRTVPECTRSAELLTTIREAVQRRGYVDITKVVTAEITRLIGAHDDYTVLVTLCMLHALAQDERHAPRLKKQISNLRDFRTAVSALTAHSPEVTQDAERFIDEVIRGLTPTLSDYYHGPGMEDLNEAVEKFKLLCEDPTILNGVEGNEGMKSGVLLIGEPGLGKTSLVEALEGELGVKCFKVAPVSEDLASPAQLLASARRTVEEVKKLAQTGKPCMFFIDEAESLMRSRKDPLSSIEQKTLTCYLLQEIDEIRRKFPKVFLVAATNYIDEVDEGMLRQGRYDLHVFYGRPDPHMRKNIVVGTLAKANIDTSFTPAELEVLVSITEGLKPLSIKQTIIDLHRFGSRLAQKRGQSFEFGFETLKSAYEKEQLRLKRSEEALETMKKKSRPSREYERLSAP